MMLSRRTFLRTLSCAAAVFAPACGRFNSMFRRPNILFVMTDDQTAGEMSCYGNTILRTPNMDRIADEGARFDNAFCTNSLCAPGRASILTGCYSAAHGIRGNSESRDHIESLNPDIPTFPEILRQEGYYTALIGKYHIRQDPRGFDEWRILPGQGVYTDPDFIEDGAAVKAEGYVTDVITDKALDVLKRMHPQDPFCLLYQHKAPHRPFTPAPRHADLFRDIDIPHSASYGDDYATRKIAGLAEDMKFDVSLAGDYPDLPEGLSAEGKKNWIFQRFVKDHYRAVYGVDENLGRILDFLDRSGMAENTLVIYTSDNGYFLGEHGWYDKRFMYEPSLRVPLVIRYPRLNFRGREINEMVLNVDVAPTILDAAGVRIPESMHGRSLIPLLHGDTPPSWRQSVYYAYYEDSWRLATMKREDMTDPSFRYLTPHRVGPHHGVRTERYKLIQYYTEDGYHELFDLAEDPNELNNLYGRPEYSEIASGLMAELLRLQRQYGDRV